MTSDFIGYLLSRYREQFCPADGPPPTAEQLAAADAALAAADPFATFCRGQLASNQPTAMQYGETGLVVRFQDGDSTPFVAPPDQQAEQRTDYPITNVGGRITRGLGVPDVSVPITGRKT